jgi:hypothetical protein
MNDVLRKQMEQIQDNFNNTLLQHQISVIPTDTTHSQIPITLQTNISNSEEDNDELNDIDEDNNTINTNNSNIINNNDNNNIQSVKQLSDNNETLLATIDTYKKRLKNRNILISEIRKAYLRDVVIIKNLLDEFLTAENKSHLFSQWKKCIPSIDLRQFFMIYAPEESSMDVIPCETCGGTLEIVHHDSSEIEKLAKEMAYQNKNKDELKVECIECVYCVYCVYSMCIVRTLC